MDKAVTLTIKGIKCDHCDFINMEVLVEEYPEWLNKPCPICGENLLTQDDYDKVQVFRDMANMMNEIFPAPGPDEQLATMQIKLDGTGNMELGPIELISKE